MRKPLNLLTILVVLFAAVLFVAWPYIRMEFAGSAHYTEQDTREYEFYTPDILKKMPRISSRYDFDFANITGPASHVYAIRYYDADDSGKIDTFLSSQGFQKQNGCHIDAVCWIGTNPQEIVTVSTLENPKAILVSIIYNY